MTAPAANALRTNAPRYKLKLDRIARPSFADGYEARAKVAGVTVTRITVPDEATSS